MASRWKVQESGGEFLVEGARRKSGNDGESS